MSFVGGGSDNPSFYKRSPGAVLSTSINKHMYIAVHPYWNRNQFHVRYSKSELADTPDAIEHPFVREALRANPVRGVVITSNADIPAGTGLGSSSAYGVGLLHALQAFQGKIASPAALAAQACDIDINKLKHPIGKQDHYACAFGGLNVIEFLEDETVKVHRLPLGNGNRNELNDNLLMFYTGETRDANTVLKEQSRNMGDDGKFRKTQKMVELVWQLRDSLHAGDLNAMGDLLHRNWELKRSLATGIADPFIDGIYARAMAAGALGGKLLGAGGRGFMLFYVEPQRQAAVRAALADLRELHYRFDTRGTTLIHVGEEGENDAIGLQG